MNLILRPSGLPECTGTPWALQLRNHGSVGETEYYTIANVSNEVAKEIVNSGAPYWLFGEPNWTAREKERQRARRLEADAKDIRDKIAGEGK